MNKLATNEMLRVYSTLAIVKVNVSLRPYRIIVVHALRGHIRHGTVHYR